VAAAQVVIGEDTVMDKVRSKIASVLEYELENINEFCMELAQGRISLY
jgi:S-adenosylmethionine synthetase